MGKIRPGQEGRVYWRRLPPIQWGGTAAHPDGTRLPIQWGGNAAHPDGHRLPPIKWAGTAAHPDGTRLPPIQWTDLYLPAIRCPPQAQGIQRIKARGSELDGRVEVPSHPGLAKRKKRWKDPSHYKESSQQHEDRTTDGLCVENCTRALERPILEEQSTSSRTYEAPSRTGFQQEPKVQKILVDLRAALENVQEPWGFWEGCSDTRSISGGSGTPGNDQEPIEDEGGEQSIQTVSTDGRSTGSNRALKEKEQLMNELHPALPPPGTKSTHREHESPCSRMGPPRNRALKEKEQLMNELHPALPPPGTKSTHLEPGSPCSRTGPPPQRQVSLLQVREDGTLASQMLPKPQAKSPASFPKIILQPEYWMNRPGRTRLSETVAEDKDPTRLEYSVDLQLPTALLLQRVRDHTSSKHHELIAQVLCALRQGNGAEPSAQRVTEAPNWNQNLSRDNTQWNTKEAALQNIQRRLAESSIRVPAKEIAKFTWQKSRLQAGGRVPLNVPQDLHWKGCISGSIWLMEGDTGETHLDTHKHHAVRS